MSRYFGKCNAIGRFSLKIFDKVRPEILENTVKQADGDMYAYSMPPKRPRSSIHRYLLGNQVVEAKYFQENMSCYGWNMWSLARR